ncbi:MAG: SdpI family protein [Lachnospiraceae bacterium]|nr:SdpI family protein [Lachnospiraceae bacterium]
MKNRKLRILTYLLALAGILLTAVLYPILPEQIPTHWNMDGTVTYGSRYTIFITAGMGILFAVLFDILPKIDPRRKNYEKFGSFYDLFCVLMEIFMLMINGVIITETLHPGTLSVPMFISLSIGILFVVIGNFMPKFKSNFYMGIKTPWTLSSDEVWRKTHRLGGRCFFLSGLLFIICAFLPEILISLCVIAALIACFIPGLMSWIWWRQEQKNL